MNDGKIDVIYTLNAESIITKNDLSSESRDSLYEFVTHEFFINKLNEISSEKIKLLHVNEYLDSEFKVMYNIEIVGLNNNYMHVVMKVSITTVDFTDVTILNLSNNLSSNGYKIPFCNIKYPKLLNFIGSSLSNSLKNDINDLETQTVIIDEHESAYQIIKNKISNFINGESK
jgi:hypothetical protein